ncbi:ATP-binding protein [Clostridium sp. NSJ-145]|uniref:ATP-binding protein n=1 Tax=Clostridium sp. NSJ-145 TaxID=2897777 RepID=UPI001E3C8F5A|nr:ATP-binding protein [Clostridium sp. NSJ-145]MCD2503055.1 ATP-binding protein [Clostridium sp. NSJ-145]
MAEKFFLSSVYITIMLIISFIVLIAVAEIFNTTIAEIAFYANYKKSIAIFINRFIQFICISILSNNIGFIKYIKNKTLYVGGTILVFHHILIFIMERDLVERLDRININIIIIVFSLCIIQILLIYVLNTFSKETEEKFLLKMELDRKMHDEEIINMYTRMIRWKHDARNHISMILGLLEAGTKEEVISYINEITSNITKLDKNMYSNNIAINSILMSKMKMAEEKNIKVNLNLKIDSEIKISNVDICIIMGNLLDNSIEACNVIEGDKFIDLKIASEMNRLVVKISNNTNGYVNEVNGRFLTTKHSNMNGIGLIQIDKVVKKYNGYINRKHENNIFTTYLMV